MAGQSRSAARRAIDAAVAAVPGSLVERVASVGAPLTRFSGRTRTGAAALSSALAALTRPPHPRAARLEAVSIDAIAQEVGRTDEEIREWADAGLLGEAPADGAWPAATVERAELVDFLLRHGVAEADVEEAARNGRLSLLLLERVVGGQPTLTGIEVARRAGVPLEFAERVWAAFGFPAADVAERRFSRQEVYAMRVIGALGGVFTEDDLIEAASVVGRAMAEVSAASVELFRRRVTVPYVEAGVDELDAALRLAAMSELLIPPLEPVLEVAFRRHLQAAVQAEAAVGIEEAAAVGGELQDVTVGFADLVGFTTLSERLDPLALGAVATRLLHTAEPVFAANSARTVKSIGDAVMFTARAPTDACRAALGLVGAATQASLPPVRAGLACGPVLRAYADYFGRTVNIASRLCDAAGPGEVLVHVPEDLIDPAIWSAAGLDLKPVRRLSLKGIKRPVDVFSVRLAG
ncbi:MAG TPA: adenylate cyclase regulatory domain-containing protein [Candidatus Dormibacteraeota bacterium]